MKIIVNSKEYTLQTKRAIELGVLVEKKPHTVSLTDEEVLTLRFILARVGGPPEGTRGHADRIDSKLRELPIDSVVKIDCTLVDSITDSKQTIYFK
jgi:hypothetical protein